MAGWKIFYIDIRIMLRSQYSVFYGYFKEFRELLIEGLFFGKNFKQNGEGANGSLPFFVRYDSRVKEVKWKSTLDYGQVSSSLVLLCCETVLNYENLKLKTKVGLKSSMRKNHMCSYVKNDIQVLYGNIKDKRIVKTVYSIKEKYEKIIFHISNQIHRI
jgi:hypothetical protein